MTADLLKLTLIISSPQFINFTKSRPIVHLKLI